MAQVNNVQLFNIQFISLLLLLFKYGLARYKAVDTPKTGEFSARVVVIVCQNCLDMYERCLRRGADYNTFSEYFSYIMDTSPELSFIEPKSTSVVADSEVTAVDAACEIKHSESAVCKGVSKRLAESAMPRVRDITVSRNFPYKANARDKDKDKDRAAVINPHMLCSAVPDSTVCSGDITSNILVSIGGADHIPILRTWTDSDTDGDRDAGIVTADHEYKAAALCEFKKKGRKPKLRLCEVAVKEPLHDYCSTAYTNANSDDIKDYDNSTGMDVMDILEAEVPGMGMGMGIPHDSEPPTASCTTSQATYYSNSTSTRGAVVTLVNDRRHWKGSAVNSKASEAVKKKQKIFNPNIAGSFAKTRPTFN